VGVFVPIVFLTSCCVIVDPPWENEPVRMFAPIARITDTRSIAPWL
jgi:hypothetical protein